MAASMAKEAVLRRCWTRYRCGALCRATGVPVSGLVLARCGRLTDGDLKVILGSLNGLQCLDLKGCSQLTDAALRCLARYSRQQRSQGDSLLGGAWVEEEEEEAASQQLAALALEARAAPASLGLGGAQQGCVTPRDVGTAAQRSTVVESPHSAVGRIAGQLRSQQTAAADVRQAQRAGGDGLTRLVLRGAGISAKGVKALLQAGSATARSLQVGLAGWKCREAVTRGPLGPAGPRWQICVGGGGRGTLAELSRLRLLCTLGFPFNLLQELDVSGCPNLGGDALDVPPRVGCCCRIAHAQHGISPEALPCHCCDAVRGCPLPGDELKSSCPSVSASPCVVAAERRLHSASCVPAAATPCARWLSSCQTVHHWSTSS